MLSLNFYTYKHYLCEDTLAFAELLRLIWIYE